MTSNMSPMIQTRRSSVASAVAVASVAAFAIVLGVAGCDQLNKPLGHPSGSSSSSGGSSSTSGDAGDPPSEGGVTPAPTVTAQPGDIHI
jgi:hypothetical protein